MKSFKEFIKKHPRKKHKKNSGIAPEVIHFKYVGSSSGHKKHSGIAPEVIHFKHVGNSKKQKRDLKESEDAKDIFEWRKKDDNSHLHDEPESAHPSDKALKVSGKIQTPISSAKHAHSIHQYALSSKLINKKLLQKLPLDRDRSTIVKDISEAMDKHPSEHSYTTYSGLGFDPREHVDEHGILRSPAFISTTVDKYQSFSHAKPIWQTELDKNTETFHIASIKVNKGSPAIHIPHHSEYPEEFETIIKPNGRLKYKGTTTFSETSSLYKPEKTTVHHIHHFELEPHED